MTDEEAVRFMVEEGFQEQAMAEKKLLRAKLDSTQLAQYFLGLDEIEELEARLPQAGRRDVQAARVQRGADRPRLDRREVPAPVPARREVHHRVCPARSRTTTSSVGVRARRPVIAGRPTTRASRP